MAFYFAGNEANAERVSYGNGVPLLVNQMNSSISGWFKFDAGALTKDRYLLGIWRTQGGDPEYGLGLFYDHSITPGSIEKRLRVYMRGAVPGTGDAYSNQEITANVWHHVLITFTSAAPCRIGLYVDGVAKGGTTANMAVAGWPDFGPNALTYGWIYGFATAPTKGYEAHWCIWNTDLGGGPAPNGTALAYAQAIYAGGDPELIEPTHLVHSTAGESEADPGYNRMALPAMMLPEVHACLMTAADNPEAAFTHDVDTAIVVMSPDEQGYTPNASRFTTYCLPIATWAAAQIVPNKIKAVVHMGDGVSDCTVSAEWDRYEALIAATEDVLPTAILPGNHDWPLNGGVRRPKTAYDGRFPASRWSGETWWVDSYPAGTCHNMAVGFTACGLTWIILTLEFGADDGAIAWAKALMEANPRVWFIVATHTLLEGQVGLTADGDVPFRDDAALGTDAGVGPPSYWGFTEENSNTGAAIFLKLLRSAINVALALGSHIYGAHSIADGWNHYGQSYRRILNRRGGIIHAIHANYQEGTDGTGNGGAGFVRLLQFRPGEGRIQVTAWTPVARNYSHYRFYDYVTAGDGPGGQRTVNPSLLETISLPFNFRAPRGPDVDGLPSEGNYMAPQTAIQQATMSIGGMSVPSLTVRTGEAHIGVKPALPAGVAGAIDDGGGVDGLPTGHGFEAADVVGVHWIDADGIARCRRDLIVDTAGASGITFEVGGAGDALPVEDTAVVVGMQVDITMLFPGPDVLMFTARADQQCAVDFQATGSVSIAARAIPALEGWNWAINNGWTNPLDDDIVKVIASNGGSAEASLYLGVLYDAVGGI